MSLLDRILESKRAELEGLARLLASPPSTRAPIDVASALRRAKGAPLAIVTEIKKKSPSAGPLSCALTVGDRAIAYARGGASMISVLCDGPFFDGSFEDVALARAALDREGLAVPLLAKEYILDPRQLAVARRMGADAALLIVRIVDAASLGILVRASRDEGLEPLVEITTGEELDVALEADARVIGVNARDLDTLVIDRARAGAVLATIPEGIVAVHLSGVRDPAGVGDVARGRADAALIGEALMREDDPGPLLASLVAAARAA